MKWILIFISLYNVLELKAQADPHIIALKYLDIIEGDDPELESDTAISTAKLFIKDVSREISITMDQTRLAYYFYYLGDINFRLNDYNESIQNFHSCLSNHITDSGLVYLQIFSSYKKLGNANNAIDAIDNAIKVDPSNESYYLEKIRLYIENKDFHNLQITCLRSVEQNNKFTKVVEEYLEFIYRNNPHEIKSEVKKILKINDTIAVCYYYLIKLDYEHSKNSRKTKYNRKKLEELDKQRKYLKRFD